MLLSANTACKDPGSLRIPPKSASVGRLCPLSSWVGSVLTATSRPEGGGWTACPGWSLSTRELPWRQQDSPPSRCWIRGAAPSNTGERGGMAGTGLALLRRGEGRLPPRGASGQLASGGGRRQQVGSWARQPSSAGRPVPPPAE